MSTLKTPVVYFHTHWDREWYQPFRMYQTRLADVVDAILDRLDAGVFPCFMLDGQTVLLDDYLELRPHRKAQLEGFIRSGKLRIGPWYVMPDEFLVSGESLMRNLKHGILSSRTYGQPSSFCGYLPDTFGHSADIPTILNHFGIDTAVVWRGVNPATAEFTWNSPGGESVLGYYLADGYFQMMMHQSDADPDLAEIGKEGALKRLTDKLSERAGMQEYLLPMGGDHLGPLDADGVERLMRFLPDAAVETPERFLGRLKRDSVQTLVSGELLNNEEAFLLPGVYSGRVYLKKSNRMLEHALTRKWEPLQAMAASFQSERLYESELGIAWKTLLLNHPHDSICGCSVDAVHQHNEVRFEEVESLCQSVLPRLENQLVQKLSNTLADKAQDSWLVVNTSERPYSGVLPVQGGKADPMAQKHKTEIILEDGYLTDFMQVPLSHKKMENVSGWVWVDDVPPLGFKVVPKKKAKAAFASYYAKLTSKNSIENDCYVVSVAPSGDISVTDKITGKTYSGLHTLRDIAQQGDSYNAAPVPGAPIQTGVLKKIKPWMKGPLVAGLVLTYRIAKLFVETRIWLEAGNPNVFFESTFENKTPDHCLQVGFDTGSPIQTVSAESHFSIVSRDYDPTYDITAHMPVAPWKELKPNIGPIQRFISANGQAFFAEGIGEYEVSEKTLYLTLLRAFGTLSKGDTGVRGAQAGPPFETPGGQCLNRVISLRYGWIPAQDKSYSDLSTHAANFLGSTFSAPCVASEQTFSLMRWDNPNIVYMACYQAEKNALVLRLLNMSESRQVLSFEPNRLFSHYQAANGLDEAVSGLLDLDTSLEFMPYGLKTLRLPLKG